MAESKKSRAGRNLRQFIQFGIVGGSGTIVNIIAAAIAMKAGAALFDVQPNDPFLNLFGSEFHIRWFNIFSTIAFLVANTWNYQINRMWTFKSAKMISWWRGFFPFLLTGLSALVVSLIVQNFLMNPTSPIHLSSSVFDDSSGFRTMYYWANAISIIVAMPINFVINKVWTFRKRNPDDVVVVAEQAPSH
ncbi:GtrA family protein [Corynebacterium vitaeruminis]|uniref:GtrA/DPMS transmembrane domain-containing protein n=1 Tax=Corynebacterium vitaeruminis DSM 20294 TaxID=1224164 RepID=W5Y0J4_9CORY|nr:GtrA family protein [Corynebacterium vitaeruminis]AHI22439.1 hypothetical protein B843_05250 [Corynebacterium vitaeruminis DSM 20294]